MCVVDAEGHTVCQCPEQCPSLVAPVCGTNGVTYNNICLLRLYSCTHKKNVFFQHSGQCVTRDPCEARVCPMGARCVPSPDGRSASCICPKHCISRLAQSPVCGTDNRDYRDQCYLHRHACVTQLSVVVKYEGACDPCATVVCPEEEICQLDEDRLPVCTCNDRCADLLSLVCGSDGHTYLSECTLRLQACRDKKHIRVIYRGSCSSGMNPCKGVICFHGEECTINKFGIAQCECVSQCEPVVREVCGSDGRTYDSQCHLHKTSCIDRSDVTVIYNGPCESAEEGGGKSCKNVICKFGGVCVLQLEQPVCKCPRCPLHYQPLCGSDGVTYNNPCHMRYASCLQAVHIETLYQGVCNGCETKTCSNFSTCIIDGQGAAQCKCVEACPEEETPVLVCGTDGATYQSLCQLQKAVCGQKLPVQLDYEGDCGLCVGVECEHGARCRAGECVCPTSCPADTDEPVCASSLETYQSECHMQSHACTTDPPATLTVLFFGACHTKFKAGDISPTQNIGYTVPPSALKNLCQNIQCNFDAICEIGSDGFPKCSCNIDCSQEKASVLCGSDFRIYNSTCTMKLEGCQRQKEIRLRPLDLCKGMEVKPCNGEGAVVDPQTGVELDCGSGPHRQDCPINSYCHQTPYFSRCCTKETGIYLKSCQDSWYGCCQDKKTPAQGPDHLGCPSLCGCNKIGSYSEACMGNSEQCHCKPGVGGLKCDRCEPGFWGLPKISSGYQGCLSCGCSPHGSVREDCEQMTGRCVCKPGVQGHKCDECTDSLSTLSSSGCIPEPDSFNTLCTDVTCYYGAKCLETQEGTKCVCDMICSNTEKEMICGDDGKLYSSKCHLEDFICQVQKYIGTQDMKFCQDESILKAEHSIQRRALGASLTGLAETHLPMLVESAT